MADLATLDEVKARLDWTLDADEERAAKAALEDASDWARYYARRDWADSQMAPRIARTLVIRAVVRLMKNPDGTTQSRAGDETLAWSDRGDAAVAGTVYFSRDEIDALRGLGSVTPGLSSAPVSAWGTSRSRLWRSQHGGHSYRRDDCDLYVDGYDPHMYDDTGYVPSVVADDKSFPFFADGEGSV